MDPGTNPVQRWEYAQFLLDLSGSITPRVVFTHAPEREAVVESALDLMRELGDEGWELVTAVTMAAGDGGLTQVIYFKRPLRS